MLQAVIDISARAVQERSSPLGATFLQTEFGDFIGE